MNHQKCNQNKWQINEEQVSQHIHYAIKEKVRIQQKILFGIKTHLEKHRTDIYGKRDNKYK